MAQALYRKWRPMTWDEVVGQEHVITTLRNAVRAERVGHAYLFSGPRGTGKTTTARLLAKAANCLADSPADRPCNQCAHCVAINEGRFLDLIEIDAASNTSVEDVRDLRDRINFAPNEGRYKVYIIDEVHMLSTAAFNALLKTLEEPPEHAIFILATTEVHKIPATVLSRCQRHEFRRLPIAVIEDTLQKRITDEGFHVDPGALDLIARQATGSLRDAISLLDQLASTGEAVTLKRAQVVLGTAQSGIVRQVVAALGDGELGTGLTLINQALDGGADPRQFARQVVRHLRTLLMIRLGNADLAEADESDREALAEQAECFSTPDLLRAMRAFAKAAATRAESWQTSLPLELALVESGIKGAGRGDLDPPRAASPPSAKAGGSANMDAGSGDAEEASASPAARAEQRSRKQPSGGGPGPGIGARWREVLAAARRRDPRTQALLNSCRPLGVEDDVIIIGFSSDLLREKMEKGHNIDVARAALEEVFQRPLALRCVLTAAWQSRHEQGPPPPMEEDGMVATAVRELGAHVVEVDQWPKEQ